MKTKNIWKPAKKAFGSITLAVASLTLALTYEQDYHEPNLDSSGTLDLTIWADLLSGPSKNTGKETYKLINLHYNLQTVEFG